MYTGAILEDATLDADSTPTITKICIQYPPNSFIIELLYR